MESLFAVPWIYSLCQMFTREEIHVKLPVNPDVT